ncbi:uncharacterized protein N7458_006559 [Penicillium daleae]|uniref:Mitochondrial outer membrane translocase complex, subunit Tom5 n=1 Tax=Penicillium daleae TaxID=63821 RepID=A0AAD6C6V2_9EURO|nr:uncharacterized protein N7458_006559 [Penicillium daleae]KAJ5450110.1 hypothetical protein N7458_006559 [Penicillium daleae]
MRPTKTTYRSRLTKRPRRLGQEQLSEEEIRAGEIEASQTVQMAVVGGILLYLSPFAIDFARKFL